MRLLRVPQAFDHTEFIYELKLDGFRALAVIESGHCRLVSRNGNDFRRWDSLKLELAHTLRAQSAVLDGKVVCLDDDGRSNFNNLLLHRAQPFFCAFDVLCIHGEVRRVPLLERKRRLSSIMPRVQQRVRYVDHVDGNGNDFFRLACRHDLEGIVAKWASGSYQHGSGTSWLKIKNPSYSQMKGRAELFERQERTGPQVPPVLSLI
jgi:bifunctional non-homologous end joining protein LigD